MRWFYGRHTFLFEPPKTAREVLSFRTREQWSLENQDQVAPIVAMERMVDWVCGCTRAVLLGDKPVAWSEFGAHERMQAISHWLPAAALGEYAGTIIGEVGLPREMYDAALVHFEVGFAGGCSCRVCKGHEPHSARQDMGCKYKATPDALWLLLGECAPVLSSIGLEEPYHLYQLHEALQVAKYRAIAKAAKKEEETKVIHAKLKARGLM